MSPAVESTLSATLLAPGKTIAVKMVSGHRVFHVKKTEQLLVKTRPQRKLTSAKIMTDI